MHSYVFPGDLDKEIAKIGSQPIPYMRTDWFSKINLESESILLDLIHCNGGRAIIYTGSGTGAMSAVVENYVSTKRKTKVIISEPKTDKSRRIIPLPSFLLDYIERFRLGNDRFILTGSKKHTEPHTYYTRYKTFLRRNDIGDYTLSRTAAYVRNGLRRKGI